MHTPSLDLSAVAGETPSTPSDGSVTGSQCWPICFSIVCAKENSMNWFDDGESGGTEREWRVEPHSRDLETQPFTKTGEV